MISCEKEGLTDPIVDQWILIDKSVNRIFVEMDDCLVQSNLVFAQVEVVVFNSYELYEDIGDCNIQTRPDAWARGNYCDFNGSLLDQEKKD